MPKFIYVIFSGYYCCQLTAKVARVTSIVIYVCQCSLCLRTSRKSDQLLIWRRVFAGNLNVTSDESTSVHETQLFS